MESNKLRRSGIFWTAVKSKCSLDLSERTRNTQVRRPIGRITRAFDNQSKFGGCPFCSGRIPHEQESLASMPELARQWMEKENRCPARYVSVRSCRLAQWQCPVSKGHIYVMQISTRVKLPENKCCPSCYQGPRVNLLHFVDAL